MNLRPKTRRYLYRVAAAGLAVGATYGVVSGEEVASLLYLAAAVLGVAHQNVNDED